jgi:hypothetical protein
LTDKIKKNKQTKKQASVHISERDVDIFRVLSSGCTALPTLLSVMKKRNEYRNLTRSGLIVRLCRLRKAGYIESGRYQNRNGAGWFTLYSLKVDKRKKNAPAVEILVKNGYARERVRTGLPSAHTVSHEIAVTETIRAIKRESAKAQYSFSILDESTLKVFAVGPKPNKVFPDLLVKLTFEVSGEQKTKTIAIEFDNGTRHAMNVLEKTKALNRPTLILCNITERINTLRRVFENANDNTLNKQVCFGLLHEDFYHNGLMRSNFISVSGGRASII